MKARLRRLLAILGALLPLATPVAAQSIVGPPQAAIYAIPAPFSGGGPFSGQLQAPVSCSVPGYSFQSDLTTGVCRPAASTLGIELGGSFSYYFTTNGFQLQADETITWSNSNTDPSTSPDLFLAKDSAGVIAVKNGTSAQELRVYGTTTGSKYLSLSHDGSSGTVTTSSGSTIFLSQANSYLRGGSGAAVFLGINGTGDFWTFSNTGHLLTTGGAYNIGDGAGASPNNIWYENKLIGPNGSEIQDIGAGQFKLTTSGSAAGVCLNVASDGNLSIFDRTNCTTRQNVVAALFNGRQPTLGAPVAQLSTDATNDDPTEILAQQRVTTTDATPTTLHAITIATSTNTVIGCYVTARRTGGASGAAEDGAGYYVEVVVKNTAGTVAELAAETLRVIGESQAAWTITAAPSGATELVQVTGAAGNNVTWHDSCRTWPVNQ